MMLSAADRRALIVGNSVLGALLAQSACIDDGGCELEMPGAAHWAGKHLVGLVAVISALWARPFRGHGRQMP